MNKIKAVNYSNSRLRAGYGVFHNGIQNAFIFQASVDSLWHMVLGLDTKGPIVARFATLKQARGYAETYQFEAV